MKKWIIIAVAVLLLCGLYGMDAIIAKGYQFELISSSRDVIVADGQSTVRFVVRLTDKQGKPIEGHTVYIYASNGTLPVSRLVTDVDGQIVFRYYPYVYLDDRLTPLEPITLYLQDESNSLFFMVNAKGEFTFEVVKPSETGVDRDWQDIGKEENT